MEEEEEIKVQDRERHLIPDGEYWALCYGFDGPTQYMDTRKIYLWFRLLSDTWADIELFMPLNIGPKGHLITRGSKYYKAWCLSNGDKPPSRNAIMSPRIFKGKTFLVLTRTVKPLRARLEMPENHYYSVVDDLKAMKSPDTEQGRIY